MTHLNGGGGRRKQALPFVSIFNSQEKKKKPEKFEGKAVCGRLAFSNQVIRKK